MGKTYAFDCRNLSMNDEVSSTLQGKGNGGGWNLKCTNPVVYAIENHPNDSRVTIDPVGIVQTLASRMGTGGNNTPFVLVNSSGDGIAAPLDASYYKGQGLRQGIEREFVVIIDE